VNLWSIFLRVILDGLRIWGGCSWMLGSKLNFSWDNGIEDMIHICIVPHSEEVRRDQVCVYY
jgi:hypothetical protein